MPNTFLFWASLDVGSQKGCSVPCAFLIGLQAVALVLRLIATFMFPILHIHLSFTMLWQSLSLDIAWPIYHVLEMYDVITKKNKRMGVVCVFFGILA